MKQRLMRRHEFLVSVDGTSAATILAQTMFPEGVCNVVAGASAIDLKRGLDSLSTRRAEADCRATSLYFCG
jgi:hypothetical protein